MMGCPTRGVLCWETNWREDPPFAVFVIHDASPLEGTPKNAEPRSRLALQGVIRITCPRFRLEARLLFCPVSFEGDPAVRPPCLRQTLDPGQSVDRISV